MNVLMWSRTCYPSETPESNLLFSGVRVSRSFVFRVMLCRSLIVFFCLCCPSFDLQLTKYWQNAVRQHCFNNSCIALHTEKKVFI